MVAAALVFPSTEWFEALGEQMRAEEAAYRELGAIDCAMVIQVDGDGDSELFEVVFEGFGVKSVRSLESLDDAAQSHFVLEASLPTWREMVENIRANQGPDLEHTLNYLTLPDDPMRVTGPDQLEVDAFYRYNGSIQRFFNGATQIPTEYSR